MSDRARIVVAGQLAGVPRQGGATWAILQWILGLRRLGHDVVVVEELDLRGAPVATSRAAADLAAVARAFDLGPHVALVDRATGATAGVDRARLEALVGEADLLLNLSGVLRDAGLLTRARTKVYVDLDPAFIQLWHAACGVDMGLDDHDRHVTIGRRIGAPDCTVPDCGHTWLTTPQPIVLEHWPVADEVVHDAATTVAHWRAYGSIHHDGVHYGQKAHALRPLLGAASRTGVPLLLALGIHPDERADLDALRRGGWQLADPDAVAGTPEDFRAFVQGSWAELGIAKLGYVASRCGWFSDRSVAYLASGRPVLAQDTAFGDWLPAGEGVLAFSDTDGLVAGVEELRGGYARHRRAARQLAEDVFDSDKVLGELLACL